MPADSGPGNPIAIDSDDEAPGGAPSAAALAAEAALADAERTLPADRLACRMLVQHGEAARKGGARGMRLVGRVSIVRKGSLCPSAGDGDEAELSLEFARVLSPSTSRMRALIEGPCFRLPATSVYAAEVRNGAGAVVLRVDPPADASPLLGAPGAKARGRGGLDGADEDGHFLSELALVPDAREVSVTLATLRWWLPHVTLQGPRPPGATCAGTLRLDDIELTARDARLLADERCLNDTALDFFLRLVVEVVAPESLRADLYVASSFFFQKLTNNATSGEEGWQNVARWTRSLPGGLLEKRFVMVPVNEQNLHWWAAIVCYPGRALEPPESSLAPATQGEVPRIVCLDSALEPPPKGRATAFLRGYLWREWCERNPDRVPPKGGLEDGQQGKAEKGTRVLRSVVADVPKQANGYDCGIFIIEYLVHLLQSRSALKGLGLAPHRHWFNQDAVSHRRKRMRYIITRLQSESRRRKEADVMKLLQDDGVRAAVTSALVDLPRSKRRPGCEVPAPEDPEPPTTRARLAADQLRTAAALAGAGQKQAAQSPSLRLPVARRQAEAVSQPRAKNGRTPRPALHERPLQPRQTAALGTQPQAGGAAAGAGDDSGDEDVEIPGPGEAAPAPAAAAAAAAPSEGLDAPGAAFALLSK